MSDSLESGQTLRSAPTPETNHEPAESRIRVRDRGKTHLVGIEEIQWIEAAGDYVMLHVEGRKHMIRATMSGMARRLPERKFARIHRSTIVNLDCVHHVRQHMHGDYLVRMSSGTELRLSRRFWPAVEDQFGEIL